VGLRRLEHRTDADAGRRGRDEHHLNVRIAVLVLAQKLLPAKPAIDVPLALAIVGLGILTVLAPSSVPGLTPPTRDVMGGAGQASCGDDSKERSSDRSQDWNA
jgi:hypothetical protein